MNDDRRKFLAKSVGFVGAGIVAVIASKTTFDSKEGIGIAKGTKENPDSAKAYAMCGAGLNCGGGGGQCGAGLNCSGGGGQCGAGLNCSGT